MMKSVDYIIVAAGNPQSERWACQWFETRDLHGRGEIYKLCAKGFLWRIKRGQQYEQLAIHRDVVLYSASERIVVRMSSASLEWMRPLAEIGFATREFLELEHCSGDRERFGSIEEFSVMCSQGLRRFSFEAMLPA